MFNSPDPRKQPARYTLVYTQDGDKQSKSYFRSGLTLGFGQRSPERGQRFGAMCHTGAESVVQETNNAYLVKLPIYILELRSVCFARF